VLGAQSVMGSLRGSVPCSAHTTMFDSSPHHSHSLQSRGRYCLTQCEFGGALAWFSRHQDAAGLDATATALFDAARSLPTQGGTVGV
jgi:hypothetical protein